MRELFEWDYEGLPTQEQCTELLKPQLDILSGTIKKSWDEWLEIPDCTRLKISSMTRAGVMHDFIRDHATGLLTGSPGVAFADELPFFAIFVGEQACIRFKKLSAKRVAAPNSPIGHAYYNNATITGLPSNYFRLTCGYVLDTAGRELLDVSLTCQVRDQLVWGCSITEIAYSSEMGGEYIPSSEPVPPSISHRSVEPRAEQG